MSLWNIDWKQVTIWWLVCILVFGIGYAAGACDGKHAADRWWQANANDMVRAALSTKFYEDDDMSGGKYSRLPYPVCMEDTGIGYGLVPIPCPKAKEKP